MSFSPDDEGEAAAEKPPMPVVAYAFIEICVALFVFVNFFALPGAVRKIEEILALSPFQVWRGEWWGLVGAAFVHVDVFHLVFNMWWTKDFGRLMEPRFGSLRFALFSLLAAMIGSGAELAFSDQAGVGFSGVVYAYFGYVLAMRETDEAYGSFVTTHVIRWMLGWFALCIILTAAGVWSVANYAHGGGLLFGWLVGTSQVQPRWRAYCVGGVGVLLALTTLAASWMPWSSAFRNREVLAPIGSVVAHARRGNAEAQAILGTTLMERPETQPQGLRWLQKAIAAGNSGAMNNLAWHYATARDAEARNGHEALRLAQKANNATAHASPTFLDTLAAAHAELGDWDKALETQKKALEKLGPQQAKDRAELEAHLAAYEKRVRVYELPQR